MQEEIDPRIEITLVSRLPVTRGRFFRRHGRVGSIGQGHALGHDDLFLARCGHTEVLPGRQLEVLVAVQVLILEFEVVILQFLDIILLAQRRDLFLQAVVRLNRLNTAPTDQQHDDYEDYLPRETYITEAADKFTELVFVCLYFHV